MKCMGLDLSTAKTGMVVLEAVNGEAHLITDRLIKPKTTWSVEHRKDFIWNEVMNEVEEINPDIIAIEGYGLNLKNPSAIIPLVELGGVLRYKLRQQSREFIAPTPAEVKIFATEKGNSKKDVMMKAAVDMGYDPKTDDMADAFFLGLIGLCYRHSLEGASLKQREVIGKISTSISCK